MKRIYSLLCIIPLVVVCGCSNKETSKTEPDTSAVEVTATPKKELLTFEDSLEYILSDPWKRARYDDNSGFYDNEFAYLTDEVPLDEYITFGQITFDYGMTVENLKVLEVEKFPGDSALADVEVTFRNNTDGKIQDIKQIITVYYSNGRWIKPTVSIIKMQQEYEEKIRQAIKAAEEEG